MLPFAYALRPAILSIALLSAPCATFALADTPQYDPRAEDPSYERGKKLFGVIREILDEAAQTRLDSQRLEDDAVSDFVKRQLGVDRDTRVKELLGSAFEMITDTPVVQLQDEIGEAREQIAKLKEQIAELKERRISAPENAGVEGWLGLAEDRDTLDANVQDLKSRIEAQEKRIAAAKKAFEIAMAEAGAPLPKEQVDLLLDSVTGGDLVQLAAAYEAVRGVSEQLRALMEESGEDLTYAKRYYGMHTALIALLLEAQGKFLAQIDDEYLPKLAAIEKDVGEIAQETDRLLRDDPTRAQRETLHANKESQRVAKEALRVYREYLRRQRAQIAQAHKRTLKELRVADNTLRTVDASFQLKRVMDSAAGSFEALQSLESPGFDRIFRNEKLREEFRKLTEKLSPSS